MCRAVQQTAPFSTLAKASVSCALPARIDFTPFRALDPRLEFFLPRISRNAFDLRISVVRRGIFLFASCNHTRHPKKTATTSRAAEGIS